jgi:hypothetical protein
MQVKVEIHTEVETESETKLDEAKFHVERLAPQLFEDWPELGRRVDQEAARRRREQMAEEQRRLEEEQRPRLEAYKAELHSQFEETLRAQGTFRPCPHPSC